MTIRDVNKYFVQSDGTRVADSSGAWVYATTGTAGASSIGTSSNVRYEGIDCIRLNAIEASGNACYATQAVNLDLSTATHISLLVYIDEIIQSVGSSMTIYFITSTPGTADLRSAIFTAQKPGWNIITIAVSAFSSSGSPSWATIRQIRIRTDSSASVVRNFYFGGLWYNKRNRPKVVISFDDGYDDCLVVDSYCSALKLPVSYGIIPSLIDAVSGSYLTTAELTTLASSDYSEICCHDVDRWADDLWAVYGEQYLLDRLHSIQGYIATFDEVGSHYAIYPEGDYGIYANHRWKEFLPAFRKADFVATRMVIPTTVAIPFIMDQVIGPGDLQLIPAFTALKDTTSLATAKANIDTAITYGANCFVYGHKLDTVADTTTWVTSDFNSLMDYIALKRNQGFLDVVKFSDWHKQAIAGVAINA